MASIKNPGSDADPIDDSNPAAPRPVLISGMHRSGTSLVASVLGHAGVDLGQDLLGADRGNRHGHFEDRGILQMHENLLHSVGQGLFPTRFDVLPHPGEEERRTVESLVADRHGPFGFKDPRLCLFLDFWHETLPDARYVFLYRHPLDVVRSLIQRGSDLEILLDPSLGLEAWRLYNTSILQFVRRHPERCFLAEIYAATAALPQFVHSLSDKLDLPLSPANVESLFHPKDLVDSLATMENRQRLEATAPWACHLYDELCGAADLPVRRPAESPKVSEDSDGELSAVERQRLSGNLLRLLAEQAPGLIEQRQSACNAHLAEWHQLHFGLRRAEKEIHDRDRSLAETADRLQELTAHNQNLETLCHDTEQARHRLAESLHQAEEGLGQTQECLHETQKSLRETQDILHQTQESLRESQENLGQTQVSLRQAEERVEAEAGRAVEAETRLTDLGQVIRCFEEEREEIDTHVKNLEALRQDQAKQLDEFEGHLRAYQKALGEAEEQRDDLQEHVRKLQTRWTDREDALVTNFQDLEKALEESRENLRAFEKVREDQGQEIEELNDYLKTYQKALDGSQQERDEFEANGRRLGEDLARTEEKKGLLEAKVLELERALVESEEGHRTALDQIRTLDGIRQDHQKLLDEFAAHVQYLENELDRRLHSDTSHGDVALDAGSLDAGSLDTGGLDTGGLDAGGLDDTGSHQTAASQS